MLPYSQLERELMQIRFPLSRSSAGAVELIRLESLGVRMECLSTDLYNPIYFA